ncbi:hypothetical protein A3J43_03465 [Candidatus Uhrbacteria bacterium RIFCSPHIGHO2_12_FULL_54_23]|uniref:Plasmid stabilization protein n=2 Tax=Candidatus Uhriibacteriota TaxID=1752732 RepID=A0A1F7UND6_9BACT|nr:MAG: hypothetical protein A3J43_03465 [Candidatus Uhrbacteria bacterium RIFCSPHIGHO2_12_FULL_54_23]OGL91224.1 MAG: hypothetical protein A3J36_02175 [Candidatus Uhrbacteria bacterium RIFCSPLOWO2_02_FULL_54_37]
MASRLAVAPLALRDTLAIARYIARDNPDAAVSFITALETTGHALAEMSEMGRRLAFQHPALHNVRHMRVSRAFSAYLIFYRPVHKGVEMIRVLHGARDFPSLFKTER